MQVQFFNPPHVYYYCTKPDENILYVPKAIQHEHVSKDGIFDTCTHITLSRGVTGRMITCDHSVLGCFNNQKNYINFAKACSTSTIEKAPTPRTQLRHLVYRVLWCRKCAEVNAGPMWTIQYQKLSVSASQFPQCCWKALARTTPSRSLSSSFFLPSYS